MQLIRREFIPVAGAWPEEARRYLHMADVGVTQVGIPETWPRGMQQDVRRTCTYPVSPEIEWFEGTLVFQFGWSSDGRHWVLFGLDAMNERDLALAKEFPRILRAVVEGDFTSSDTFDLTRLRRAYYNTSVD